jgi:hypothetical protein
MPLYYSNLHDGSGGISDPEGTDLADRTAVEGHARAVVLEVMAHVEASTRHWLLEVCDESGRKLFQVPFAKIDRSIDHLEPRTRGLIEEVSQRRRVLASAIFNARARPGRSLLSQKDCHASPPIAGAWLIERSRGPTCA